MTAERQQFSLALGLAAAGNLLLLLLVAWSMAVTEGLTRHPAHLIPVPAPASTPLPDVITLVLSPEPAPAPDAPERQMVLSPDDQPETSPTDSATRFISSRDMRAASEEAPSPDGLAGRATQQGLDNPFLDLRDSDFRDGEAPADRPPAPPVAPAPESTPPPPEPEPKSDSPENTGDTPPETEPGPAPPLAPTTAPETPPAPPAFRDIAAENLLPLPDAAATRPPGRRPAASPPPPPLTRIPDRVPESSYRPGLRKSKSLGTISNKGASSVDAKATAEGRFGKTIRTAIEKTWRRRMLTLSGLANPGLVEVDFEVDVKGRISNVKLANPGEANPVMQDCALSAVIDAKLPPPPPELFEELRDSLTGGRMRCSFSFLIY